MSRVLDLQPELLCFVLVTFCILFFCIFTTVHLETRNFFFCRKSKCILMCGAYKFLDKLTFFSNKNTIVKPEPSQLQTRALWQLKTRLKTRARHHRLSHCPICRSHRSVIVLNTPTHLKCSHRRDMLMML